jgi:predicted O-methyltransferase YrrM
LIIVDNVLWSGKVIGEKKTDSATTSISDFNEMIHSDQRVEKLILPVRDGVYIIRKK